MIIQLLIRILLGAVEIIFGWFPDFTKLPTFGSVNLDTYFATGVGYFHYLAQIFPPLSTVATAAVIYLGFKGIMLIVKVVLGSRAPSVQ